MKLEIPIIVGFDDMESLLDDLKKLQTYKCFEGAEEVLVDIEDVAKVLMDHVKAKEYVKGDDLIYRDDAINAHCMCSCGKERDEYCKCDDIPLWFDVLPSAQHNVHDFPKDADCISRQAAIAEFSCCELTPDGGIDANYAIDFLKQLPSAQPEPEEIGYGDCANAMLKMWMDNVLTDGEYNRIMYMLNKHWGKKEGE